MASTTPFFDAVKGRRTFYALEKKSSISDERIHEIVNFAITHCPSTFNVQSGRAVILLGAQHEKLWDFAAAMIKKSMPEAAQGYLLSRTTGFKAGYGSVLFLEDQTALNALGTKNPSIAGMLSEWSDHSTGMIQFTVWTAFETEGLGCNLQHYNFSPDFANDVKTEWKLPAEWTLKSQLVFGVPAGPTMEKTFLPIEDRVKVFA